MEPWQFPSELSSFWDHLPPAEFLTLSTAATSSVHFRGREPGLLPCALFNSWDFRYDMGFYHVRTWIMQRPAELRVCQKGLTPIEHDRRHQCKITEAVGLIGNKIPVTLTRPQCDLEIQARMAQGSSIFDPFDLFFSLPVLRAAPRENSP